MQLTARYKLSAFVVKMMKHFELFDFRDNSTTVWKIYNLNASLKHPIDKLL